MMIPRSASDISSIGNKLSRAPRRIHKSFTNKAIYTTYTSNFGPNQIISQVRLDRVAYDSLLVFVKTSRHRNFTIYPL